MTIAAAISNAGSLFPIEISSQDVARVVSCGLLCLSLLYTSNYYVVARNGKMFLIFNVLATGALVFAHFYTTVNCRPLLSLRNFPIFCGLMKSADMLFRYFQNTSLIYKLQDPSDIPPPLYLQALYLTYELRYEAFTPNPIRIPNPPPFHEPTELLHHILFYIGLSLLPIPQSLPPVRAIKLLLYIYILWTAAHLPFRTATTAPFFAPLYTADSLADFWNGNVWHVAFQSPCQSIAYMPVQTVLRRIGINRKIARGFGVIAAFGLMGVFHGYVGYPVMVNVREGCTRVISFFVINGFATVVEDALWGRKKTRLRAALAWTFEITIASWAVSNIEFPLELWIINDPKFCQITVL